MNQETRQRLFDHLSSEHNLHLLESEIDEIINIVSCENDAIKTLVDDLNLILEDIKSIQDNILNKVNRSNEELIRFNERMKIQHELIRVVTKYNISNEK